MARRHVLALADRLPTGWFAGILTGVFLAITASFGGLESAASAPVPDLVAGDEHRNHQFDLSVQRAVLIDELPGSGTSVSDGQRVLAVVVEVENVWHRALPSAGTSGVVAALDVVELGGVPATSVARLDDATISPYLQPGIPAELVLTWAVDAADFDDGDVLHVDLRDFTLQAGKLISYGDNWADPVTAAHVSVQIRDVGAGVDSGSDSGADSGSSADAGSGSGEEAEG